MNPFDTLISGTPVYSNDVSGALTYTTKMYAELGHPFTLSHIVRDCGKTEKMYAEKGHPFTRQNVVDACGKTEFPVGIIEEMAARDKFFPDTILQQYLGLDMMDTPFTHCYSHLNVTVPSEYLINPHTLNGYACFISCITHNAFLRSYGGGLPFELFNMEEMISRAVKDGIVEHHQHSSVSFVLTHNFQQLYSMSDI